MTLPSTPLYPKPDFPSEKVCTKCGGDPQPLENFHKDKTGKYGRQAHCKKCVSVYHDEWAERRKLAAQASKVPESKVCTNDDCGVHGFLQPIGNFYKDCTAKDGYCNWCKACHRVRDIKYREGHTEECKEKSREWYKENTEYAKMKSRKWRDEHPKQAKETRRKYVKTHTEELAAWTAQDRKKKPEKYYKQGKKYKEKTKVSRWAIRALKECKKRSIQKGVHFDIQEADIMDKRTGQLPIFCPIFPNIKLSYTAGPDRRCWASVDRIVPELGYVPDNVWIISLAANSWKANGSNKEERRRLTVIMNGRKKKKEPDAQQPSLFDDL